MPAGLVLLPQTPLQFKHAYWFSAAARWMPGGPLSLNQHACRSFASHSCMSAVVVLLYLTYLLVWCLIVSRACWCGAHYRPRLLVQCLTMSRACWCGASLSAMSVSVVLQYRPCLLPWYLNRGHACWSDATVQPIFDWWGADGRRMVTSLVLHVQRCHYIRHVC